MKHSKLIVVCSFALLALTACDTEKVDLLKSPCASLDGGPCGPKRNVNGWWLETDQPSDRA